MGIGQLVAAVYINDYIQIPVQHDKEDLDALDASASLASDHLHLFRVELVGETLILAPTMSANWELELDLLGWKLNTHTLVGCRWSKTNWMQRQ